jgi:queuosine biosynthesis protein QueC
LKTLVLLSGGLDSTAALIRALASAPDPGDVHALFVYYGQPSGQRESERARAAARELGVQIHRSDISGAFNGYSTGFFRSRPSGMEHGVDTAFVPGRNAILISTAASRALTTWPRERIEIVVGFNETDVRGFPDCSPAFRGALENVLNLGLGNDQGEVRIGAPWQCCAKAEIVAWVREHAPSRMPLIEASWSCYRERGPCGECTACLMRATAF